MDTTTAVKEESVFLIERPARSLFKYYLFTSLFLGPLFFIPLIPLYFRYHTLRYRFDTEGISMRWGILFRREINLTYARIQDIHIRSNILERWLGLARVEVQTASGSSGAEMVLEGLEEFELVRDYLYTRMRGGHPDRTAGSQAVARPAGTFDPSELVAVLHSVTQEIRALRTTLENQQRHRSGE